MGKPIAYRAHGKRQNIGVFKRNVNVDSGEICAILQQ
jgi:hypothetical protein